MTHTCGEYKEEVVSGVLVQACEDPAKKEEASPGPSHNLYLNDFDVSVESP